jgi:hypothetical protein
MKRPAEPPQLHLASSATEQTLMANSDERLRSVLATLEECRVFLVDGGNRETAQLVSVAILELRMKLNRIADTELKALCDAMSRHQAAAGSAHDPKSPRGRRSTLLKLIK